MGRDTLMNNFQSNRLRAFSGLALGCTIAFYPVLAAATGVTAGTLIENTATATFNTGAVSSSIQSNTVTVRVDELLNVAVTPLNVTPVPLVGTATSVLAYTVTNSGNGSEAFNITVSPAVAGNDFDAVVQQIAVDTNGNGTYDPGVDQVLTSGSATPAIADDGSVTIFVVVASPGGLTDGDASQVRLTAEAVTGTGTPGATFAGQGAGGGDAVVGTSGATGNGLDSLVASLASVALSKSAVILDPFGGSQPVPGAVITYTLSAAVSGSGQVSNLHVTDVIPAGTSYQIGTLTLDASALTDATDADAGEASSAGIDVDLGIVTAGTTKVVKFNVTIN